jgi:hypothetical protein
VVVKASGVILTSVFGINPDGKPETAKDTKVHEIQKMQRVGKPNALTFQEWMGLPPGGEGFCDFPWVSR